MCRKEGWIPREEAKQQVLSLIHRLALLHYCFSRTLVEEVGKKEGKKIIHKAIALYGNEVGKKVKQRTLAQGLPTLAENFQDDLPSLGWEDREKVEVQGEKRARVYACPLAQVWKGLGAAELGRIYCFVDQAKYAAYNPELTCVHTKNVLNGDPYCELAVRAPKTTPSRSPKRPPRASRK